ncbi:MAG: YceG family protein [Bacillota bacterium]
MSRYETVASKAQDEIRKMLSPEDHVFRPWQVVDYDLEKNTLKTTIDEVGLLYEKPAYLRPGFYVENETVYVPNLFIKLSGKHFDILHMFSEESSSKKHRAIYNSIEEFSSQEHQRYHKTNSKIDDVLTEGLLDKEKLYGSDIYKYVFVKKQYQDIIVDKINFIVKNKESIFKKNVDTRNKYKMINALLSIDEQLILLFHDFDFQYGIPSVIIYDEEYKSFTDKDAYVLALLNLLGLDIIIISQNGYANIENILNEDLFTIYYPEKIDNSREIEKKPKKKQEIEQKSKKKQEMEQKPEEKKKIVFGFTQFLMLWVVVFIIGALWSGISPGEDSYGYGIGLDPDPVIEWIDHEVQYGDPSKDKYQGEWLNEKRDGYGIMLFANGDRYAGQWENDMINGSGTMYFRNGDIYEGQWVNNVMHGEGKIIFHKNGDIYEGEFQNNRANGTGKYTLADGDMYEGTFEDNKPHGICTAYYNNGEKPGTKYEGEWVNGIKEGKGKLYMSSGQTYEGDFGDGSINGFGIWTGEEGELWYEGQWVYDMLEGYGKVYFSDGERYEGELKDGFFHGRGTYYNQQGEIIQEGIWERGDFKGQQ